MLWVGIGGIFDNRIAHSSPWGYFASDAIHNLYMNRNLYEVGNWKYTMPYMSAGYTDVVNFVLPLLAHINVNLAYTSGLHVYDTLTFVCVLFASISALIMYVLVRDYNKYVAYLSVPLFAFLFFRNFYNAITWGQVTFVVGSFFLVASVYVLLYLKEKNMFVILAIFMSAIFFAHTSEFFFFIGFLVVYLLFDLKKVNFSFIKKLTYSFLLFAAISFYYAVIFARTYYKGYGPSSFKWFSVVTNAGFRIVQLGDFGAVLLVAILLGAAMALYLVFLERKSHPALLLGLYMLGVGFLNYIGIGNRPFQTRFFWPLYLSVFFGLVVYQIMKLLLKNPRIVVAVPVSVVLSLIVIGSYYQRINDQGLLNQGHWDTFQYLKSNTPEDSRVYFFYGDTYDQNAQLLIPARFATYVMNNGLMQNVQNKIIPRTFFSRFLVNAENLAYRKSFFSYGYHLQETNITTEALFDVCNYDYYVFDKASAYAPVLAQYNMMIMKVMLETGFMEQVYSNDLVAVLKNNNPGGDCIPKDGVKLS